MKLKPWGTVDWLLPRTNVESWHIITSASFEDRCVAVVEWFRLSGAKINSSTLYKIENPPSGLWDECAKDLSQNLVKIFELLSGVDITSVDIDLLGPLGAKFAQDSINPNGFDSVILDITTLPKRFFYLQLSNWF